MEKEEEGGGGVSSSRLITREGREGWWEGEREGAERERFKTGISWNISCN